MKTTTKVICVAAALLAAGALALAGVAGYYLFSFVQGTTLANQSENALQRNDYDRAIREATAALGKPIGRERRVAVLLNRAIAHNYKHQYDEAIRDFSEALRLAPESMRAYEGRAWAYQQKRANDKAIDDWGELIKADPNSTTAYYQRGLLYLEEGQLDEAISDLGEAARVEPANSEPLLARGLAYARLNNWDQALVNFDAAILINPRNARAFRERATVYARKGDSGRSEHDEAEARRLGSLDRPGGKSVLSELSRHDALSSLGRPLTAPRAPIGIRRDYTQALDEGGKAFEREDYDSAITAYNAALKLDVTSEAAAIAVLRRGNCYVRKDDLDKALQDYEEALKLNPRLTYAYTNRASILAQRGEFDDALKDFAEALRLDPTHWKTWVNRAITHRDAGNLEAALADYEKAIELNPKSPDALLGRGGLYIRQRKFKEALQECEAAVTLDPKSIRALTSRASAYAHLRQYEKAEKDLNTAESLPPPDSAMTLNAVAWFRATCPDGKRRDAAKAVAKAIKACELSKWRNWGFIDTLAAAYAEAGQFQEAVNFEKMALSLAKSFDEEEVERAKKRLSLYERKKPYREQAEQ